MILVPPSPTKVNGFSRLAIVIPVGRSRVLDVCDSVGADGREEMSLEFQAMATDNK
jgi:hypothetical protein